MKICPECNKQELRDGEELCPHCANKKTNFWVKTGEVVFSVALLVGTIIITIVKKKDSPQA